ncbi:MAG TPA: sigma-70 family RNA polymerase sigma factor [Sphingomicrobium sp.]|nr:sigma-70 family RNA polymerase sigma factor [Sphingomicrobium sp.]
MSWSGILKSPPAETTRSATPDDRELLARIAGKDLQAFERMYRIYQPRLTRFLTTLLKRPQLIEEVLDDTMMVVWQTAGNFRGSSKPSTWIFAIAYRKAHKAKRRWPDPVEEPEYDNRVSEDPAPDDELHHQRLRAALMKAMDQLSPDHRAVVDLTYFHGMGYREIAEIVDCPVDTVKTRMFHARRRLKQAMTGSLVDWI